MSEVEWLRNFGNALTEAMEYTNTEQAELADILGMSQSSISRLMNGQQMPDIRTILLIAHELDWHVDDLVNFGDYVF